MSMKRIMYWTPWTPSKRINSMRRWNALKYAKFKFEMPWREYPVQGFRARKESWIHKRDRNDYLKNPAVMYPIYNRLPEFWRREYEKPPPIIHQKITEEGATKRPNMKGLWKVDKDPTPEEVEGHLPIHEKRPYLCQDHRIDVDYSDPEIQGGLWGGEGLVQGWRHGAGKNPLNNPLIKGHWKSWLQNREVYSEILDRHMKITMTPLTLDKIDAAYGFDFYILKTPINELCSQLGNDLKREMQLKLARKDSYPDDAEKQSEILRKYKDFIIDEKVAEWTGLTLKDAMWKQWNLEKESGINEPTPLLEIYSKKLREELNSEQSDQEIDIIVPVMTMNKT